MHKGARPQFDSRLGGHQSPDWLIGWKPLFWSCALIMAANIFPGSGTMPLRSRPTEPASPEFTLYYRTLFWGELIA